MADMDPPIGETGKPLLGLADKTPVGAADSKQLVVRVLNGTRAGSEAALPASGRASIGYEY